jgi:hypothetical protein
LLLDMVVDRLHGTTHDGGAGTARMHRLQQASAPFTGEVECATHRYSQCVSVVHAGSFGQQPLLQGDTQERNTAPTVLPLLAPPGVQHSLEAPFGQLSWADKAAASGTIKVVLTNPPVPPVPLPPPAPPIVSSLYDDEEGADYEDSEAE